MASFIPNVTDIFPDPSLYTPDFGYMDTMLKRRQAMYQQGLSEISNKYRYISREVINPANVEDRDRFISQAKTNLKDVSALDLSRPQNVKAAMNVFEPFVKNTNVLGDMALAEHYNQQISIADSYRNKDGGKDYSDNNLRYVMMQKEDFAKDSPDSWGNYYGNRRYFTPYRDYSKKLMEAYEKFKPHINSEPIINGGAYNYNKKTTSIDSAEFRKFLDSYLDEQDKKQIEIDGVVKYGSSPEMLRSVYGSKVNANVASIDNEIKKLEGYNNLAKTKEEKDAINSNIEYYKTKRKEYTDDLDALMAMDPVRLKQSKDRIAANIYLNEKLDDFSKSVARKDVELTAEPNQIWMTIYKEQQANQRQLRDIAADLEKAKLEAAKKGKGAENPFTGDAFVLKQNSLTEYGSTGLENELIQSKLNQEAQRSQIAGHLVAIGLLPTDTNISTFIEKSGKIDLDAQPVVNEKGQLAGYKYRSTGKDLDARTISDLQVYQNWKMGTQPHKFNEDYIQTIKNQLESDVKKDASNELKILNQNLTNINKKGVDFYMDDGRKFNMSLPELYSAWKTGGVKIDMSPDLLTLPGMSPVVNKSITVNGKVFNLRDPKNRQVSDIVNRMVDLSTSPEGKKVNEVRSKVYNSQFIDNAPISILDATSDLYKEKKGAVEAIIGKDVLVRGVNRLTGDMMFSFKDDNLNKKDFLNTLPGVADIKFDEASKMFSVNLKGLNVLEGLSPFERILYNTAANPVLGNKVQEGVYSIISPPFVLPGLNYNFQWRRIANKTPGVDGTSMVNYNYYLYAGNNKTPILGQDEQIHDPLQFVTYINQLANNPIRTIKFIEGSLK